MTTEEFINAFVDFSQEYPELNITIETVQMYADRVEGLTYDELMEELYRDFGVGYE